MKKLWLFVFICLSCPLIFNLSVFAAAPPYNFSESQRQLISNNIKNPKGMIMQVGDVCPAKNFMATWLNDMIAIGSGNSAAMTQSKLDEVKSELTSEHGYVRAMYGFYDSSKASYPSSVYVVYSVVNNPSMAFSIQSIPQGISVGVSDSYPGGNGRMLSVGQNGNRIFELRYMYSSSLSRCVLTPYRVFGSDGSQTYFGNHIFKLWNNTPAIVNVYNNNLDYYHEGGYNDLTSISEGIQGVRVYTPSFRVSPVVTSDSFNKFSFFSVPDPRLANPLFVDSDIDEFLSHLNVDFTFREIHLDNVNTHNHSVAYGQSTVFDLSPDYVEGTDISFNVKACYRLSDNYSIPVNVGLGCSFFKGQLNSDNSLGIELIADDHSDFSAAQEAYLQDQQIADSMNNQPKDIFSFSSLFNFTAVNPFSPIFALFVSGDQCVQIPIIAAMVNAPSSQMCPWFKAETRNVLTPVLGIVAMMLVFGYFVRWLSGSSGDGTIHLSNHKNNINLRR